MIKKIADSVFSLNGASLGVGAAGFVSAIVGMFVDVNGQISVKWLILVVWLSLSIAIILLKIIFDLTNERKPPAPYENPIKSIDSEGIFVIRRNENFINSIVVGCYHQKNDIDRIAYLGTVHLVQEKVIQVRILNDYKVLPRIPVSPDDLKEIVIRPVVPISALNSSNSLE